MPPPPKRNPGDNSVVRERLLPVLRERFDRRLTVIVGGAGFGKSTLLRQALMENAIEQLGVDAYLRVDERDRTPAHLCQRLADAIGAPHGIQHVEELVDAIWGMTPTSVALLVDDAHVLDDAEAWAPIDALLRLLPRNGHLVVAGRRPPMLPVARWQASDQAVVIDEDDLRFDAEELVRFGSLHELSDDLTAELPPWPALATLAGLMGHHASMRYLWEEVLADLAGDRRDVLHALAPLDELDDDLIRSLEHPAAATADALIRDLPMVEHVEPGVVRLHDLWREAMDTHGRSAEVIRLRRRAGDHLAERGEIGRAANAYATADAHDRLEQLCRRVARRPSMWSDTDDLDRLIALLPPRLRATPIGAYVEAARAWCADERLSLAILRTVAARAAADGDRELEVVALWRIIQFEDLDTAGGPVGSPTLAELRRHAARGMPLARAAVAFVDSRLAQTRGDADAAIAALGAFDEFDDEQRANSTAIRLIDLGRPEAVPATLESVLTSGLADIYQAQAVWQQGLIDPAVAWPIARSLVDRLDRISVSARASAYSVLATIATAAGDIDAARALVEQARRDAPLAPDTIALFAEVAHAGVVFAEVGEEAALVHVDELLTRTPLGRWPERPYLYLLCVLRGLTPGGEVLDDCSFGPALTVAVEAGAALAEARAGDPLPARRLPWHERDLLRVHVPSPLLVELALAASPSHADDVLAAVPHPRRWLERIAARPELPTAASATARLAQLPARPGYDLEIEVLGGLTIRRSDRRSVQGWDRRERVRQLLGYLVLHPVAQRADVAAALWPELTPDKASANLRVNLTHLQHALQPERTPDEHPWFVVADNVSLQLADDGVVTDLGRHDAAIAAAVAAEAAGMPSVAVGHYTAAIEVYGGPLLAGVDAPWAELERIRVHSSVHAATARLGELLLARGDPEQAMHHAVTAQRLDPLSERAHRLFIRCHLAVGSTSAARGAAQHLVRELDDAGLAPERETQVLVNRLGVS